MRTVTEIKKYSDNLSEPHFESLLLTLQKYGQSLDYFDSCARRMGRYMKKNKPLKDWPWHLQLKYLFVTEMHKRSEPLAAFTT